MQPPNPMLRGIVWQSASRTNTIWTTQNHTVSSTHVWGTPTQIISSTAQDSHWVQIRCNTATGAAATRSDTLMQLYAGSAGNEHVIAGPLEWGGRGSGSAAVFPIYIPAGTRLSVAVKSARTGDYTIGIEYWRTVGGGEGWPTRWVAYGITSNASNSVGTLLTPGTSSTWGAWASLTTNTTYAHSLWIPMAGTGTGTTMGTENFRFQYAMTNTTLAADAATNGTTFEGPCFQGADSTDTVTDPIAGSMNVAPGFMPIYCPRQAGSSISARCMSNQASPSANRASASILAAVM